MQVTGIDQIWEAIIAKEGTTCVDQVSDGGGRTRYGITQRTFTAHNKALKFPFTDVCKLTQAQGKEVMVRQFKAANVLWFIQLYPVHANMAAYGAWAKGGKDMWWKSAAGLFNDLRGQDQVFSAMTEGLPVYSATSAPDYAKQLGPRLFSELMILSRLRSYLLKIAGQESSPSDALVYGRGWIAAVLNGKVTAPFSSWFWDVVLSWLGQADATGMFKDDKRLLAFRKMMQSKKSPWYWRVDASAQDYIANRGKQLGLEDKLALPA